MGKEEKKGMSSAQLPTKAKSVQSLFIRLVFLSWVHFYPPHTPTHFDLILRVRHQNHLLLNLARNVTGQIRECGLGPGKRIKELPPPKGKTKSNE